MKSARYQLKNEFGGFTSVFVLVNPKDKSNFIVEVTVRGKLEDERQIIKKNTKTIPLDKYDSFIEDLEKRIELAKTLKP